MSNNTVSAKDQLEKLRAGQNQKLEIKYGELVVRCRILSADQLADAMENGRSAVKLPKGTSEDHQIQKRSTAVCKSVLRVGTTVNNTPYLNDEFLDNLSSAELEILYDQYLLLLNQVNPEYDKLSEDEILVLIARVKKKTTLSSSLTSYQLAEIGRYFLEIMLPQVNEHGSG